MCGTLKANNAHSRYRDQRPLWNNAPWQEVFIADIDIEINAEDQGKPLPVFFIYKIGVIALFFLRIKLLKHTMSQGHKHTLSSAGSTPPSRIPQRARRGGGPWRRIGDPPLPASQTFDPSERSPSPTFDPQRSPSPTFEPPERSPSPTLPALSMASGSHASELAGPSEWDPEYTSPTNSVWDPFIYGSVPRLVLPPPPPPPSSVFWLAYAEHQDGDGVGGSEEDAAEEHDSYSYAEYDDGDDEEPADEEEEEEEQEDEYYANYEDGNEDEDSYDGDEHGGLSLPFSADF